MEKNEKLTDFLNEVQSNLESANYEMHLESIVKSGKYWMIDRKTVAQQLKRFHPNITAEIIKKFKEIWDKIQIEKTYRSGYIDSIIENDKKNGNVVLYNNIPSVLVVLDRNVVLDLWREGDLFFIKRKDTTPTSTASFMTDSYKSKSAFLDYCFQHLNPVFVGKIERKSLNDLCIPFKTSYKQPILEKDIKIEADKVNVFNPGWLSKAILDPNIPNKLTPALEVLLNNIFGTDKITKNWVLQWMRHYMHTFDKMMTAVVFWGSPGTGKSMLAEAFGQAIGDSHSPKQNQIEDVRFNTWVNHAVLILDEVSSGSKKDGKAFGDYLKGLITQPIQSIEGKGKEQIQVRINNCFIITSNTSSYIAPVFIEEKDRRYTIVCNDDEDKNLRSDKLWSENDFNDWDSGNSKKILMKYIYNLPEDKSIILNKGIDNSHKQTIQNLSKNSSELIIDEFIKILMEDWDKPEITWDELKDLMESDGLWDEHKLSKYNIRRILQQKGFTVGKRVTRGNIQKRCIVIPEKFRKIPNNEPLPNSVFPEKISNDPLNDILDNLN